MKKILFFIWPVLLGMTLLTIPLLRDLHFESAMLAGTIGCFWAGIRAAASTSKQDFFATLKILGVMYLTAIPLFIFALVSGCLSIDGVGFWIFIPLPSLFFGTAVGRLIRQFRIPFPNLVTVFILLFCALGIWLWEFFTFPQVYFYNHVWGLWPGPIYDESVSISGSFLFFRWLTFLWIILLWIIPNWDKTFQTKIITGFALFSLLFGYLNLDEAGIISPEERIQQTLSGNLSTIHFELFYDEDFYSEEDLRFWAARHEFFFQEIVSELKINWPDGRKIHSYLYAHPWQKKKLTGAKFTSYVPIWLEQDQLHIAKSHLERVLKHEMVHVISKQFGNRLFNGSWKIGLIEGLAEAISGDASSESTLHQLIKAEKPWPTADEMKTALSWRGFYAKAGAISYTTSGSFARYLLDTYPVYNFKQVYQGVSFEAAYEVPFAALVSDWHQTLQQTSIDSVDQQHSEFIFAQRSLFEKPCPHAITRELRLWDTFQFHLAERDTLTAYKTLDDLYHLNPKNDWITDEWVKNQLKTGNYEAARQAINPNDTLLTLKILKADALFLAKNHTVASAYLQHFAPNIESSSARNFRHTLKLREDSLQWSWHLKRRYQEILPDSSTFLKLNLPNQMLTFQKTLNTNDFPAAKTYMNFFADSISNEWFEVLDKAITQLSFRGELKWGQTVCAYTPPTDLRLRFQDRFNETCQWVSFISNDIPVAD